nr:reverse transcriptase domain-containing protein [Tanacetum cinerariifolium]
MQTRSSSKLVSDQISNPTSSTNPYPKGRNRRRSKQRIENLNLKEDSHPIFTMTDQRTMAELLRAPTEGYAKVIVVPSILAEQFELKHSLINIMTTDQFFELEKDNPHDHIRWFNKITSTIKYKDVPSSAIKLMLFPFFLVGAARQWLEKEPLRSIHTYLVSKFINEFLPPSRTTNLRNEILNYQQRFDESFHEAWDRYKDLLHACPYYSFTELHQLDTFYNALNPTYQDSLNDVASGNLLERSTQDVLTIIENKSKQTSAITTAMTAMLKQFQATLLSAPVKAVEETCITCGGAHPYYQYLTASGNNFPELRDNIQGYVSVATVNYNQGNPGYRPPSMANQIPPPAITTRSGLVIDGPTIPTPPQSINPKVDERVEETFTDPDLAEYTIKVPPPPKLSLPELIPTRMTLELANRAICTPAGIARDVFVPVGKFTFSADFVIVDYESDPRVPFILGRPFLRTARALIDVHGKEMILHDCDERLNLNMRHNTSSYSNQPQKESIKSINVFNNSSKDFLEALFPNQPSGNPTFSSHPELTLPKVNKDIFDSEGCIVLSEKLLDLDYTKDLHPSSR